MAVFVVVYYSICLSKVFFDKVVFSVCAVPGPQERQSILLFPSRMSLFASSKTDIDETILLITVWNCFRSLTMLIKFESKTLIFVACSVNDSLTGYWSAFLLTIILKLSMFVSRLIYTILASKDFITLWKFSSISLLCC